MQVQIYVLCGREDKSSKIRKVHGTLLAKKSLRTFTQIAFMVKKHGQNMCYNISVLPFIGPDVLRSQVKGIKLCAQCNRLCI